jgi:hypothetical protein
MPAATIPTAIAIRTNALATAGCGGACLSQDKRSLDNADDGKLHGEYRDHGRPLHHLLVHRQLSLLQKSALILCQAASLNEACIRPPAPVESTRRTQQKTARRRSVASYRWSECQAAVAWLRRRRQATKPPSAITRPGKPVPTIGPGTAEASSVTTPSLSSP